MEILTGVAALREHLARRGQVGFVPTMGNLHDGHLALMRVARNAVGAAGCVTVSIFVNRLQFGPNEDFESYPRTFETDCARCEAAGVDVVFAPDEAALFAAAQTYLIEPDQIQHVLDGQVRPGHFRGVATIVLKLLNIVQPRVAVFGKKDYQQCRMLAAMVEQLNVPVELVLAETVRAADGLALSSRNSYLSSQQRHEAPRLFATLQWVGDALRSAGSDIALIEAEALERLTQHGWQVDYVAVRRQADLQPPEASDLALVVLAAARLGRVRLIDNLEVARTPAN